MSGLNCPRHHLRGPGLEPSSKMKLLFKTVLSALALLACTENPTSAPLAGQKPLIRRDRTIPAHSAVARELTFSPNGLTLATSSVDSTVKLWNLEHGWLLTTLAHPTAVASIAYSPDGKRLVSGAYDGGVRVWNLAESSPSRTSTGHTGTVWSVAFSPDGQRIASSGEDRTIRLWRAADGAPIEVMIGHALNVRAVDFSPDGKYLASGSFDKSVRLWDPSSGAPLRTFAGHDQAVVGVDFSPNGKILASSGDDSSIRLWNVETGQLIRRIDTGNHTYKIAFTPNGEFLVSGGRARSAAGTLWHQLTAARLGARHGEPLKLWRVSDGSLLQTLAGEDNDVRSVATSPDGKLIASASEGRTIRIWRFLRTAPSVP